LPEQISLSGSKDSLGSQYLDQLASRLRASKLVREKRSAYRFEVRPRSHQGSRKVPIPSQMRRFLDGALDHWGRRHLYVIFLRTGGDIKNTKLPIWMVIKNLSQLFNVWSRSCGAAFDFDGDLFI
jgi:hypothetical protein